MIIRPGWIVALGLCSLLACSEEAPAIDPETPLDGENDAFAADGKFDANGVEEHSFEAACVLNVANRASFAELDDDASLARISARGIVEWRAGDDGVEGTADDRTYYNLDQLDAISWVGWYTFNRMKKYALAHDYCPQLAEETIPFGEAQAIEDVMNDSLKHVHGKYDGGERPSRRDAHPKAHGCTVAFVDVDPAALDADLRVGVFASKATYKAWIRFSNGSFNISPDPDGDIRGMAIKLMGVGGEKLLADQKDAQTQDILLINTPTLMVRNALDYVEFARKTFEGNPVSFFAKLDPDEWHFRELLITIKVLTKKIASPLLSRYWSTVPYLLGEGNAVKYSARPCYGESDERPKDAGDDYLKDVMATHLLEKEACFDLLVQRQLDPATMPIEDPTIEWDEDASPFVKVATIRIPAQTFLGESQVDFCENLSFTPWHSLPEHKPLGGINRARLLVYEAISKARHAHNAVQRVEPTSHTFE